MSDEEGTSLAERVEAWFEAAGWEHGKFERIPPAERLHESRKACGLLKILSLLREPARWGFAAEHDIVYVCDSTDLKDSVTEADVVYLARCGVHYDSETDSLAYFC